MRNRKVEKRKERVGKEKNSPWPFFRDVSFTSRTGGTTRILNHAASYAEAYLRVSALLWPIVTSPYHAAQIHAVKTVLSDPNEVGEGTRKKDCFHSLTVFRNRLR